MSENKKDLELNEILMKPVKDLLPELNESGVNPSGFGSDYPEGSERVMQFTGPKKTIEKKLNSDSLVPDSYLDHPSYKQSIVRNMTIAKENYYYIFSAVMKMLLSSGTVYKDPHMQLKLAHEIAMECMIQQKEISNGKGRRGTGASS